MIKQEKVNLIKKEGTKISEKWKKNKQTKKKHKQLRKSYLENHNYDPSRANAPVAIENEALF